MLRVLAISILLFSFATVAEDETDYMRIWQMPPYCPECVENRFTESGIEKIEDVAAYVPYADCNDHGFASEHLIIETDFHQENDEYYLFMEISARAGYELSHAQLYWPSQKKPKHQMYLPLTDENFIQFETSGKKKIKKTDFAIRYHKLGEHNEYEQNYCLLVNLREHTKMHNKSKQQGPTGGTR